MSKKDLKETVAFALMIAGLIVVSGGIYLLVVRIIMIALGMGDVW